MALPSDKPPSYEEATSGSLSPTGSEPPAPTLHMEQDTPPVPAPRTSSLPASSTPAQALGLDTFASLPCPLHPADGSAEHVPEKHCSDKPVAEKSSSVEPAVHGENGLTEAMELAKAHEAEAAARGPPPPPGWTLSSNPDKEAEARAQAKAYEAAASSSHYPNEGPSSSSSEQNLPPPSFSLGGQAPAQPVGVSMPPPAMSGAWMSYAGAPPSAVVGSVCPGGLEPLLGLGVFALRENFAAAEQGFRRGATVVCTHGEETRTLLLAQRAAVPPPRHGSHRRRPRCLEMLDASGGTVVARLESTKRSDILSVEVQSPPGSRVARVETRPAPPAAATGDTTHKNQLAALVFSAAEQLVFRLVLPSLGALETQPIQQVVSASSGGSVGSLSWAWGTEADLLEAQLQLPVDLDVRMKLALLALALVCMEAFSSRWGGGRGSGVVERSLGQLNLQGPKPPRRRRHR